MKTVAGLFDEREEARRAVAELEKAGFGRQQISMLSKAAESAAKLRDLGTRIPEPDVRFYQEGVRQGGSLVVVDTEDKKAQQAVEILARYKTVDVDSRSAQYQKSGVDVRLREFEQDDLVIPVIQEEIAIGKRAVESGRMRVYTHVVERPVEAQVTLRDETVTMERRPVNRTATAADQEFREGTMEMTERDEEAVVTKQARVVEEVVVGKEVTERTETIHDSIRRTDVKIDEHGSTQTPRRK